MITAVTTGFALMAEAQVQRLADIVITLSLPGGVYPDVSLAVVDCDIESSTTTSSAVKFQTGTPSASASFTLAGQIDPDDASKTAAWLFRRWNSQSPLWRLDALQAKVTIDVGFIVDGADGAPEMVRQFTGYVDSYSAATDGSVKFQCVDLWTRLRAIPETGAIVDSPTNPIHLTGDYLVDYIMRQISSGVVASTPWQRPNCRISATLRGCFHAEVGRYSAPTSYGIFPVLPYVSFPVEANGSYVKADSSGLAALNYEPDTTLATTSATTLNLYVEQQIITPASGSLVGLWEFDAYTATGDGIRVALLSTNTDGSAASLIISINPGGTGYTATSTRTFTLTHGTHLLEVFLTVTKSGTYSGTSRWDGTPTTVSLHSAGSAMTSLAFEVAFLILQNFGYLNFQVATPTSMPATHWGFVPTATYQPSLNPITVVPAIAAGTSGQTLVEQVGAAELAESYFDENEHFWFRNRNDLANLTVDRTITSESSLSNIDEESVSAAVVNRAQVGFTEWSFGAVGLLWKASTVWSIPARSTLVREVKLSSLFVIGGNYGYPNMTELSNGASPASGNHFYRAATNAAGTSDATDDVLGNVEQIAADRLRFTFTNSGRSPVYLVSPSNYTDITVGTPAIWVGGSKLAAADESLVDYQFPPATYVGSNGLTGAAGTRWGEQPWTSTGVALRQDPDVAGDLAEFVVDNNHLDRPVLSNVTIQLDPRLQLLDWVHIVDPDSTYIDDYAQITNKSISLRYGQITQTVDVQCASSPGGWLLGITGRTEIDDDATLATAYLMTE